VLLEEDGERSLEQGQVPGFGVHSTNHLAQQWRLAALCNEQKKTSLSSDNPITKRMEGGTQECTESSA
jgi:hypothetical protein